MPRKIMSLGIFVALFFSQNTFAYLPDVSQAEGAKLVLVCFQQRTKHGDLGIDFNLSLNEFSKFFESDFAQSQMESVLVLKEFPSELGKNRFSISVSKVNDQININLLGVDSAQSAVISLQKDSNGDFKGFGKSRKGFAEGSVECGVVEKL